MLYQHQSDMQLLESCGTLNFELSGYPQQVTWPMHAVSVRWLLHYVSGKWNASTVRREFISTHTHTIRHINQP